MPQQAPVFFIIGPQGHGKTAAREFIAKTTFLKGGSCSDAIYAILAERRQVPVEDLRAMDKEQLRPTLIALGDFLCMAREDMTEPAVDPTFDANLYREPSILVRTLYLNGYNVIDGVRRRLELQNARQHLDWNGVRSIVIYVHDPRKGPSTDNTEDLEQFADNVVVNDGTLEDLHKKLLAVLDSHFPDSVPKEAKTEATT